MRQIFRFFQTNFAVTPESNSPRFKHPLLVLAVISVSFTNPSQLEAQIANIFGGTPIDISDAPYQVSLEIGGGHGCGAAIINAEWVLTAGHCVDGNTQPGDLMVHAGATDQTNNAIGQRVAVDQIIIHPNYTPFGLTVATHDLALLHLATPLCFNEDVQPVIFATPENTAPDDLEPGTPAFITGWGDSGAGCCNGILLGAGLPVIGNADANTYDDRPR